MQPISYKPIAVVHHPINECDDASKPEVTIEFFSEFVGDMVHLEPLSHICIIYNQHAGDNVGFDPMNEPELTIACIKKADPIRIVIDNADIPDQARVLNIKPYTPAFDVF